MPVIDCVLGCFNLSLQDCGWYVRVHVLRLQWIMNLQHRDYTTCSRSDREKTDCTNPKCILHITVVILSKPVPGLGYRYNVGGGYSGRPVSAALHDSRTRRLLARSPECR